MTEIDFVGEEYMSLNSVRYKGELYPTGSHWALTKYVPASSGGRVPTIRVAVDYFGVISITFPVILFVNEILALVPMFNLWPYRFKSPENSVYAERP